MVALPPLSRLFRPVLAAAVTLGLTYWLYTVAEDIDRELADKSAAYAGTEGVTLWNPLTWGNAPREIGEDVDLKVTWAKGRLVTGAMWFVGIGGGIVTTYLVYKDLVQPTAEVEAERRRLHELRLKGIEATGEATGKAVGTAVSPAGAVA